jgi:hypothetical protein
LQLNHAVEVIGKVQQDLSVRVLSSTDLGPEGSVGQSEHYFTLLVCLENDDEKGRSSDLLQW